MTDISNRPTEQHFRCPNCKVPRFLAATSRGLAGSLRIKCPKCRQQAIFDLATGGLLTVQPLRTQERELRCGACRWFLAGVIITSGSGSVRVQCPNRLKTNERECKRNNRFACSAETVKVVELPVG